MSSTPQPRKKCGHLLPCGEWRDLHQPIDCVYICFQTTIPILFVLLVVVSTLRSFAYICLKIRNKFPQKMYMVWQVSIMCNELQSYDWFNSKFSWLPTCISEEKNHHLQYTLCSQIGRKQNCRTLKWTKLLLSNISKHVILVPGWYSIKLL